MKITHVTTQIVRLPAVEPLADGPVAAGASRDIVTLTLGTDAGIEGIEYQPVADAVGRGRRLVFQKQYRRQAATARRRLQRGNGNNTAWRLSSNRLLTDSQFGALISTAALPNGARHSRNNAVHAGSSASSSKRKGSTGVVKLTP